LINTPKFQLVFSVIAMVMIANLQYSWGLFTEPMKEAHSWSLTQIAVAFSIFINLQVWVQPMEGWFVDKLGPRPFITVAGVLCGVGWSLMGRASSLPELYFLYGMAGIGAAFVYSSCIGSALKWFPDRRGAAAGLIAAGFGGGSAAFVPLITYLIKSYNYQTAFLVTGVIQGVVITVVAQFLRHPGPEFLKGKPVQTAAAAAKSRRNTDNFTTPQMFQTPHFYILYLMFVAMATGGLFVTANSSSLVKSWGMTTAVLTTVVAMNNVANGVARVFWGWVSDRIGRENTMVVTFFLHTGCLISVVTLGRTSSVMLTTTLILTFFTWGQIYSLFPSTNGDYFGSKHATSNYSFLYSAKGVASIIGAPIAAWLFGVLGSWDAVIYGSACLAFLSGCTALVLRTRPLPQKSAVA